MTEMEKLQQAMALLPAVNTKNPTPSKPGEYSAADGPQGETLTEGDPAFDSAAAQAPVAPPVTAAARGKALPGTIPVQATVIEEVAPAIATPQTDAALGINTAPAGLKLVFTGISGAGKSFVAQQLGLTELSVADPIIDLYSRYFPGAPTLEFINNIIVWAEGIVDAKAPVTPARLTFVHLWRELEREKGFAFQFGTRGYLQQRLLARAAEVGGNVVITSCTDGQFLQDLKAGGFQHYQVHASPQSVGQRKRRQGANDRLAMELNAQLTREISMRPQGQMLPVIWSDSVPAPSPRFFTYESFRAFLTQAAQSKAITGE